MQVRSIVVARHRLTSVIAADPGQCVREKEYCITYTSYVQLIFLVLVFVSFRFVAKNVCVQPIHNQVQRSERARHLMEQLRYTFPIVAPTNNLSQHTPNVNHLDLAALGLVLPLWYRIRHNQSLQSARL